MKRYEIVVLCLNFMEHQPPPPSHACNVACYLYLISLDPINEHRAELCFYDVVNPALSPCCGFGILHLCYTNTLHYQNYCYF